MLRILQKSGGCLGVRNWRGGVLYNFSAMPPNIAIHKAVQFQFKFRSILKLQQLNEYIVSNKQDIIKYGKTILLQFLNEYPMQSFRRSRDELDPETRQEKYKMRQSIYMFLCELEDLNFYQLNMRYSIFRKLVTYGGPQPAIIAEAAKAETQLVYLLANTPVHVTDVMNWLFMLPLNYKQEFSSIAFDLIDVEFSKPAVREYYRSQRSLPALVKRTSEKDWAQLRKYKNIIKFFCYEASIRNVDSLQQTVNELERLVSMKFHLVGEKVIPKIVDEILEKFNAEFELLTKNKQTMLRVFSIFKYLPLNYNIQFFNKVHNFLKTVKELPSHLLLYLPCNKLSQSQVSLLQSKMFAVGREDIANKLIYTIYQPEYKEILTPFIIKQAYINMIQMWKKEVSKVTINFQIYLSLIFRFSKINNPIIDQKKIRQIFTNLATSVESDKYDIFSQLSIPAMISFLQLCALYDVNFNQNHLIRKMENVIRSRRDRNTVTMYVTSLMSALKVHYNAMHRKSRKFLTQFICEIANNPQVEFSQKIELLFLIEKTMRPQAKWQVYSNQIYNQLISDVDAFMEIYIKYQYKTLKLTNFIFTKLLEHKVDFSTVIELLGGLNLKLVTSLKGKLISPLKKYIVAMDLTMFDLEKSSLNTLAQAYRLLFYFKKEIPDFMEYFSIKLIEKIQHKCKEAEYVNGKQFASLSTYIMEVIANIEINKKTSIIESIVSIIKTLRKKEGLYLKVYQLDFLCSNQKYIRINNDVLEHHWADIMETLRRTDRFEQNKQLILIVIKLHCRQFVELSTFDLRHFVDKCTQLIDQSVLNLPQIKECLGYDILNCEDSFVIEKMKLFMSGMIKLAFRKDKRKHSYFMYEYYLKLFSKLESREMIIEICQKLLHEKLYPVEVSSILPILNNNDIKSKKFIKRILQIMSLSESYVSYQRMHVLSWLQKIMYELPDNNFNLNKIRQRVQDEIIGKALTLKQQIKTSLNEEERSIQSGYQVDDPDFDRNYKIFIEYAWASLKTKAVNTVQFKFICRYLFFSIQRIKSKIQNPEERKQISKIKLYHVLKYIKEMGFFEVDNSDSQTLFREKNLIKEKTRKNKLLSKMEKDLNVMKIQTCSQLENQLAKYTDLIEFKTAHEVHSKSQKVNSIVEYFLEQKDQTNKALIKNKFVIHTVKKYHCNPQIDSHISSAQLEDSRQTKTRIRKQEDAIAKEEEEVHILDAGYNENLEEIDPTDIENLKAADESKNDLLEETDLSLMMKPQKQAFTPKVRRESNQTVKPLFSLVKAKKPEQKQAVSQKAPILFETVLKIEKPTEDLYKDYNGYLKVEKSLIELSTGLKCIIYDPERDIFFD